MAPVSMLPLPVKAQQRWTLLAVCLAALALPLSFSAGAVAVPALARSAASSPTALAWVTNAFMLTFGSLLLAAGGLADRYGRRRLFLLGTAGFTIATVVVYLAPTLLWLDLARGLQGVAAAAALASGTALLAQAWQGPARPRVFALLVCAFGLYLLSRQASHPSLSQWVPLLMLVGAGTALPWGLMDGLSVSVVPVQRAGMAAGIFGTVRVAGEGIALAAVTALLALLIGHQLQGASPASLARAGAYLATGAWEQAQALLPAMSRMQLQHASSEALATLLSVLALLTAACAVLLHLLLRKRKDALVGRTA